MKKLQIFLILLLLVFSACTARQAIVSKDIPKDESPIPTFMAGAYDIVFLVTDAIAKNGENAEKIRDNLYSVKNFEGAVGKISFDKNGDVILGFSVKQVKNGELATLK